MQFRWMQSFKAETMTTKNISVNKITQYAVQYAVIIADSHHLIVSSATQLNQIFISLQDVQRQEASDQNNRKCNSNTFF